MKRLFSVLLVVGLVGFGLSFLGAPWFAFRSLRAAAAAGDVQGVAAVVDYNALRQSLRPQLGEPALNVPPPSIWQDPIGAIGRAIRPTEHQADIDSYLTPQALAELTNAKADEGPRADGVPFKAGDLLPGLHGSEVRFWDPNRSRIAVVTAGKPDKETVFTFERRGLLAWKLVHIGLPQAAQP